MTIEWTEGAYQDYDELLAYLVGTFGINTAIDFQARLDKSIAVLRDFPFAGVFEHYNSKRNIEYRSLSCRQYKIVYTPMSDRVVIVSLWNNRQNPVGLRYRLDK
jgi:plasmid stabilization system protein ParE